MHEPKASALSARDRYLIVRGAVLVTMLQMTNKLLKNKKCGDSAITDSMEHKQSAMLSNNVAVWSKNGAACPNSPVYNVFTAKACPQHFLVNILSALRGKKLHPPPPPPPPPPLPLGLIINIPVQYMYCSICALVGSGWLWLAR